MEWLGIICMTSSLVGIERHRSTGGAEEKVFKVFGGRGRKGYGDHGWKDSGITESASALGSHGAWSALPPNSTKNFVGGR